MVLWQPLNGIEWYCGPLSGVSSGIDSLSGFRVVLSFFSWDLKWYSGTLAETGPEWYFWDFQWHSLNGTVAPLNGIEWYCGPLSGVSSGIDPLSGVSSGIELLFPGI